MCLFGNDIQSVYGLRFVSCKVKSYTTTRCHRPGGGHASGALYFFLVGGENHQIYKWVIYIFDDFLHPGCSGWSENESLTD